MRQLAESRAAGDPVTAANKDAFAGTIVPALGLV